MKKNYDDLSPTQKEALINEYKGNLFEYLVAHQLSRHLGIERQFLEDFGGEAKKRLESYEAWLRQNDRDVLKALGPLAEPVALHLSKKFLKLKVYTVLVVGKSAGGMHNMVLKEADLLILSSAKKDADLWGVSLKLCKMHAFVNTKSGGLKSFFSSYFNTYIDHQLWQERLNSEVERSFQQLGHDLYESQGLGEFKGQFDERWQMAGLSHLPGEIPESYRLMVHENYQKLIKILHQGFKEIQKQDPVAFSKGLESLMGFGGARLQQLICFYQNRSKTQRYIFDHIQEQGEVVDMLKEYPPQVSELKANLSSFEININDLCLQIRVKPMNKFTQASYKVNCSIKKLKSLSAS